MKLLQASAIMAVIGCAALAFGCAKKQSQNFQPNNPPQDNTNNQPYQPQPAAPEQQPPPAPVASVVGSDPAVSMLMAPQLAVFANSQASGMRKEGDAVGANLQEGQALEQIVMLQPGKCYTVVGLGLPMIQDMSITMVPSIPISGFPDLMVLSQSLTPGSQVTMAPSPNCYKHVAPLPIQAKVVIRAKAGSGPVGAQVYVK